jgi:hypothetical protein
MKRRFPKLLLSAIVVLTSGVALSSDFRDVSAVNGSWRPGGARLTVSEAVHIAEIEARRNGENLSDYLAPRFRYMHDDRGYVWEIFYDGKIPADGNEFWVNVNDRTQQAEFEHGR